MKKVYLYIVPIIFVFLSAFGCPEIDTRPPSYPYDPEKAGVSVESTDYLSLNEPNKPNQIYHPQLSKDNNYIYIPLEDRIAIFNINDLTTYNKILIDASSDLSVDISVYQYTGYGMIVHNDKIVTFNYFIKKQDGEVIDKKLKYLQMDKDGSNKKLLTFNEAGDIMFMDYNVINKKIMLFNPLIASEYTYDNTSDTYIYNNNYSWGGGNLRYRFSDTFRYDIYDGGPYGEYLLTKRKYEYSTDNTRYVIGSTLKTIDLHYLHIDVSNFAVDGEYIWLLSREVSNNNYKLMKVKPL